MTNTLTKEILVNNPKYIVPISYDLLFRELFGKNPDVTAFLISALLNIPYRDVKGRIKFKDTTVNKNTINSKHGEKDVLFTVEITEPLCINLEMNYKDLTDYKVNRNMYYHADTFSTTLNEKKSYKEMPTVIQFNFNDKFVNTKDKPLIDTFLYRDEFGYVLSEKSQIVHINVAEMREMWYNGKYKERSDISKVVFLLSAIIYEVEKKKFDKLLKSRLVDKEISKRIGDVVYSMNEKRDFRQEFEDFMADQRENWEASKDEIAKQITEELTEEITRQVTEQVTQQVTEQVTRQVTEQVTQQNCIDMILQMYDNGISLNVIAKIINMDVQDVENIIEDKSINKSK